MCYLARGALGPAGGGYETPDRNKSTPMMLARNPGPGGVAESASSAQLVKVGQFSFLMTTIKPQFHSATTNTPPRVVETPFNFSSVTVPSLNARRFNVTRSVFEVEWTRTG